jgi:catechol 2,3-dioxygenase-like lactoylglutathione lyase family enzyme
VSADAAGLEGVLETCLYHDESEREPMEAFYGEILGLEATARWPDGLAYRLGAGVVLVFDRDKLAAGDGPIKEHGTRGPGHSCFTVERDAYVAWRDRLGAEGVEITHEQEWPGGRRSFYFKDPAGNLLEIADGDLWLGD